MNNISIGIIVSILTVTAMQWMEIKELKEINQTIIDSKDKVVRELQVERTNNTTCKGTLDYQNSVIDGLRTTIANFKPKTVKDTVYVYLPAEVNTTRGDCNDTKAVIDFIRNTL